MSQKYYAIVTSLGAAKIANAAALGTKLNITQMAVGDGGGTLPTPNASQTKLVNEKRRAAINTLSVDPANASQVIAEQVIPETEGGFWIREMGLFDADGNLIAVCNTPETYKPALQEGSGRTQTVRMVLIVNSTDAITLKIDPSVVLATRAYVESSAVEVKQYTDTAVNQARGYTDAEVKKASSAAADDMKNHVGAANPHTQYPLISNALSEFTDAGNVPDVLKNLSLTASAENLIINGGFTVNQRGFASGATLAAGAYGHDRWKAGNAGCVYTFGTTAETVNVTSGSLLQIIEGANNPGGSLTVTWEGTAKCRINGGSYAASPLGVSGLKAGDTVTLEFGTGTVTRVQCSAGKIPFTFRRRHAADELRLCQRYWQYSKDGTVGTYSPAGGESHAYWFMKVTMRAAPTVALSGGVGTPYKSTPDFVDVFQSTSETAHYAIIKEITLSAEL